MYPEQEIKVLEFMERQTKALEAIAFNTASIAEAKGKPSWFCGSPDAPVIPLAEVPVVECSICGKPKGHVDACFPSGEPMDLCPRCGVLSSLVRIHTCVDDGVKMLVQLDMKTHMAKQVKEVCGRFFCSDDGHAPAGHGIEKCKVCGATWSEHQPTPSGDRKDLYVEYPLCERCGKNLPEKHPCMTKSHEDVAVDEGNPSYYPEAGE